VLQYAQEATAEAALATYASGSATFVSLDSAIPQALVPPSMVQMPLSGVALVVAYNLPELAPIDWCGSRIICSPIGLWSVP
jgi:hypothetical protein